MKSVECFLTHGDNILMLRGEDGMLTPLMTEVGVGESPIEASVRVIVEHTGHRLTPSCAGLYFRLKPGHVTEDGLAFVAEVTGQNFASEESAKNREWVKVVGISDRDDVSASYHLLITRFLAADHPLVVVLASGDDPQAEGESQVAVSSLDPAVLSPLVFAI